MTIDNKTEIYRIRLRKMVITMLFTVSIVLILLLDYFNSPDAPVNKYYLIIGISIVFITINVLGFLRYPYYLQFKETEEMLIFKYYPLSIFNNKRYSFQIPKKQFIKFESRKSFFGRDEQITLFQLYRTKVSKYPPISLSALKKKDREKLKQTLHQHSHSN